MLQENQTKKKGKALSFRMYELIMSREALSEIPAGLQRREWIKKRWKSKYFFVKRVPELQTSELWKSKEANYRREGGKTPATTWFLCPIDCGWTNETPPISRQEVAACCPDVGGFKTPRCVDERAESQSCFCTAGYEDLFFYFFYISFLFYLFIPVFYHSCKLLTISSLICAPKTHKGYLWI